MAKKKNAKTIVRWLLDTGRLREYRVAELLAKDDASDTDTDTDSNPGLDLDPGDRDEEEEQG